MGRNKGWRYESGRHALAARGVKSGSKRKLHRRPVSEYPLREFLGKGEKVGSHYEVEKVPWEVAEGWMGIGYDPDFRINDDPNSPEASEMVALAKKYGGTLEGYVIPEVRHKGDTAGIFFEGFTIPCSDSVAQKLLHKLTPDEFWKAKDGWRFWWD